MKVWIDTDIGGDIDDALTLLLAMASEEVQLVGVSTVFENTLARAKIAKTLLVLGGFPEVPVYAGEGQPYVAESVHGMPVDVNRLPKTYEEVVFGGAKISETPALEAMRETFSKEKDICLVTLGALTNVARFLEKYPEESKNIKCLYIMGGAVNLNLNEFNFTCDPEAAERVLASPLPKKLVTLDVTFQCALSKEQIERLQTCRSAAVKTVLRMSALWGEGMILHDPLTLAATFAEHFVTFAEGNLKVELCGEFSRGKCVNLSDFNWKRPPRADMLVSAAVNSGEFCELFVEKIINLDRLLREKTREEKI